MQCCLLKSGAAKTLVPDVHWRFVALIAYQLCKQKSIVTCQ